MDKSYVESEADTWTLRVVLLCALAFVLNLVQPDLHYHPSQL